ncbi:phospholipase C, phosphocholine-specific [Corynebacterium parakroppenstedtii]|nr:MULTISPECIES: alkaline phosphatase family protein [Corynebacterium]KXB50110.1 putative phospholipase C, phosphocholine-specific [Corynebacterium kroppenstedtii]PMC66619.1 phospholipase C, phosphocholine-specific [Corynebacterium kroppenstedtii]
MFPLPRYATNPVKRFHDVHNPRHNNESDKQPPREQEQPRGQGTGLSRRSFLKGAAAGAAAVGASTFGGSLLPRSILQQIATAAPAGSLQDVHHVIFLMQENRAFDHYFGCLKGVQGFGDLHPLPQRSGGTVFEQKDSRGTVTLPFSIRDAAGRQSMNAENVDALDHEWKGGTSALHGGWCDNWIEAKTPSTMAYYDRHDLPFQYELADTFTVCDQYFCSVPTSTSPNRNYYFSGYTGFEPASPSTRAVDNRAYDDGHPGYDWPCLGEILDNASVDWRVYQEWDNFTDNNFEYFRYTKRISEKVFAAHKDFGENYYSALATATEKNDSPTVQKLTKELTHKLDQLTPTERRIFDRALYRSEPHTITQRVEHDIAAGTLPPVSWIVPSSTESEHPSASSPRASANLIYRLLDALGKHPDVWKHTALFITFDENDGYFDHVPPPRPPRNEKDEWYQGKALGFGNRVPMIVVSPWSVGGYRCSEVFDHTSASHFLEAWKGISVPTVSRWRRTISGDLTSAFDFSHPQPFTPASHPPPTTELEPRWHPQPPEKGVMPQQEPGRRPHRPLPYQLSAATTEQPSDKTIQLHLTNDGLATANFLVFCFHDAKDPVRMVEHVEAESRRGSSNVAKGAGDDRRENPSNAERRENADADNLGTPGKDVIACDVHGTVTLEIPTGRDGRYAIVVKGPAEFHYEANGAVHR